jgi:hypothetical protein
MKNKVFLIFLIFSLACIISSSAQNSEVTVKKIWDKAPHSAFTDLIHYNGNFYCVFREGVNHVPHRLNVDEDGKIRVLISGDGDSWKSFALLSKKGYDLRDPKLSVTSDGKLMLLFGGSIYKGKELSGCQTHVSFLGSNGNNFSKPRPVKIDKQIKSSFDWLWRVTWHNDDGYGVIYSKDSQQGNNLYLVKTKNGIRYSLVSELNVNGFPNEATVHVQPDDNEMLILLRRDAGDCKGYMGYSSPPYQEWGWNDLGMRLGGPNLIPLNSSTFIMGSRIYGQEGTLTGIFLTTKTGPPKKIIELPSGGDTSYPGLLIYNNILWISYYSSHEGKTQIYLAKIKMEKIDKFYNDIFKK